MFEVGYLWNGLVKKDGVNANLFYTIALTLDSIIDIAFSPRLKKPLELCYLFLIAHFV